MYHNRAALVASRRRVENVREAFGISEFSSESEAACSRKLLKLMYIARFAWGPIPSLERLRCGTLWYEPVAISHGTRLVVRCRALQTVAWVDWGFYG